MSELMNGTEYQTKKLKRKEQRWKPKKGEDYYFFRTDGLLAKTTYANVPGDETRWLFGNCFKSQAKAMEYEKKIRLQNEYKLWVEERSDAIVWGGGQFKCYAFYDYYNNCIKFCPEIKYKIQGVVYATRYDIIKEFIETIGEKDFIKYVLEADV